jgi:hypothetical protein
MRESQHDRVYARGNGEFIKMGLMRKHMRGDYARSRVRRRRCA